jgi:hypothetical protein
MDWAPRWQSYCRTFESCARVPSVDFQLANSKMPKEDYYSAQQPAGADGNDGNRKVAGVEITESDLDEDLRPEQEIADLSRQAREHSSHQRAVTLPDKLCIGGRHDREAPKCRNPQSSAQSARLRSH